MSAFSRMLAPLARRVRLMVARGVVAAVNDALKLQGVQLQLLADETSGDLERFQQYGFTSVPHAGAEAVVVCVGGSRSHGLVIAVDDRRYRLKGLAAGEVALYTDEGDKIHLQRGGTIEIVAGTKVSVFSPLVEVSAGDVVADGISLKTHVHGGVEPGAGTTGAPQ